MIFTKKTPTHEWLIVGLGNPGLQYAETRHNVGFMVADRLAAKMGNPLWKHRFEAEFCDGTLCGHRVLLCKPQTFMNLSGNAVQPLAAFYKIPPERILILCDDISLPVGRIRLRRKGSAGGHNGLKNIIAHLGTDQFPRIKVGVGIPQQEGYDTIDYVVGKPGKEEQALLIPALDKAVAAVPYLIQNGFQKAMNEFNG